MADENAGIREIIKSYATSELCEILAAAVAVFGTILVRGSLKVGLLVLLGSVLLFVLAVFLRLRGGVLEASEEEKRRERDHEEMHVVTAERLKTLEVVDAGEDVIESLKPLLGQPPMRAKELIRWLKEELGHVRAQEKLEVVRRYTLTEESREPEATSQPEVRETAVIQGRGPTVFDSPETPAPGTP
jgi:hypothetical protein